MIFCPQIYTTRHQLPPAHHGIVSPVALDTVYVVPQTPVTFGCTVLFVGDTVGPQPEVERKLCYKELAEATAVREVRTKDAASDLDGLYLIIYTDFCPSPAGGWVCPSVLSPADPVYNTHLSHPSAIAVEKRHFQLRGREKIVLFSGCVVHA
uniref:Uncharacterized protein n=1 Tax=Magallana gigas TaxID=29159 RepID=K1Q352_MAGGI